MVLPQFTSNASFLGVLGLPGPLVVLLVGFVLWLAPVLLVASWVAEGRATMPHPWVAIPVGLFVAGAIVSTASAADKSSAMVRAAEMTGLWVGLFAFVQVLRSDAERRFAAAALVASAFVLALAAVYDAAYALPHAWEYYQAHRAEVLADHGIEPGSWMEQMFIDRFSGGVQATLGHPNVLASFLTLGFFAAVGLVREKWSEAATAGARGLALLVAGAAMVSAVGIVLTHGRAAAASVLVGLYWLAVHWRVRRRGLRVALYAAPLAAGAIALAAAACVDHPAVAKALLSLRYRLDYWRATVEVLRRHWLTGVGLENFGLHYVQFKLPASPEEVNDPHNLLVSAWSQLGMGGLAAVVGIWLVAIRAWVRGAGGAARRAEASGPNGGPPCGDEYAGEPLPRLLVPVMAVAAPAVAFFWATGRGGGWRTAMILAMVGVAAAGVMTMVLGVAAGEEPSRLRAAGRPLRSLRDACIVGLLAFALQEQVGTAILEPPTAWAMLALLGVTLTSCGRDRARLASGGGVQTAVNPRQSATACLQAVPAGVPLGTGLKFLLMASAMVVAFLYLSRLVLPVGREEYLIEMGVALSRYPPDADPPLRLAAQANRLAWEPAMIRARFWQEGAGTVKGPAEALALDQAMEGYRDALARQPLMRRAYLALAACRLTGDGALESAAALAEARTYLDEAARLYPTDLRTRLMTAIVADRGRARAEAMGEYRNVLRLDGEIGEPLRRLAPEARAAVEDRIKALDQPTAAPPDPRLTLWLAETMDRQGARAAAFWAYRNALQLDDRAPAAARFSGEVREAIEGRLKALGESL
jgi:tetratricopeptide (TPR) repeat protein